MPSLYMIFLHLFSIVAVVDVDLEGFNTEILSIILIHVEEGHINLIWTNLLD